MAQLILIFAKANFKNMPLFLALPFTKELIYRKVVTIPLNTLRLKAFNKLSMLISYHSIHRILGWIIFLCI